jgi:MYXO-CTERM domain-containing protein
VNGTCVGSNPKTCTASDACHVAGTCDSGTGACSNPKAPDGTGCNDNDACTQTDGCVNGTCTGSSPKTCPASDQCHGAGTCDSGTGICSNPRRTDGAACDDGNPCTTLDACSLGVCAPMGYVVCSAADECHAAGTCNPSTGTCSNLERADGTECSAGECRSGDCVPETASGGEGGEAGGAPQAGRSNASGSGGVSGSGNAGGRPASGGQANQGGSAPATGGVEAAGGAANGGQGAGNESGSLAGGSSSGGRGTAGTATESGSSQGATAGEGDDPRLVTTSSTQSKGCGCSVPGQNDGNSYAALGLAWLLVATARRRRRHAPET